MGPSLVFVAGPLKGTPVPLVEAEVTLGRDGSNRLPVADPALSRHHCRIRGESGAFILTDLRSLNGTFVNGVPVNERVLAHGDVITVGDSVLIFLLHQEEAPVKEVEVLLDEGAAVAESTLRLRREDARYLRPEPAPPGSRAERDLRTLLRASAAIHLLRRTEALQQALLELALEAVPADSAALLLLSEGGGDFDSVVGRARRPEGVVTASRTIARQVITEGAAILSNEVADSEAFRTARSAVEAGVRSVICAPLTVFDRRPGALYLSGGGAGARFDPDHLELATALAAIGAVALSNVRQLEWLEGNNRRLQEEFDLAHDLVGESPAMREVYRVLARVAASDTTVLLQGESGTGKELAARAIHRNSARRGGPFVTINCAALPESLLESELFGHEKGAFTGAIGQKRGRLELADGGTLFLDEVGELAPALQAKLLRVLQEREFERLGGTRSLSVDLRLIAASNRDLERAVEEGRFRQDLYYRLNVVPLTMPPLRARREDIPLLASYFVKKYATACKRPVVGISEDAPALLTRYEWPGNVRELGNAIERAVVLSSSDRILPEDLPEAVLEAAAADEVSSSRYQGALRKAKKEQVLKAVADSAGNITEAAKLLGVHPNYLHRLIRNLELRDQIKK